MTSYANFNFSWSDYMRSLKLSAPPKNVFFEGGDNGGRDKNFKDPMQYEKDIRKTKYHPL